MNQINWIDPNDGKMGADEYFKLLINEFPKIKEEIKLEDDDMIHLKMESFANYTIEQIQLENYQEIKRCFLFQESKIDLVNSYLENALEVSYCESILLSGIEQINNIDKYMPTKLKYIYLVWKKYYSHNL